MEDGPIEVEFRACVVCGAVSVWRKGWDRCRIMYGVIRNTTPVGEAPYQCGGELVRLATLKLP